MTDDRRDYWFPAKRSGLGWGLPCCWQGWLVLAAYVALVLWGIRLLPPDIHPRAYVIYTGGCTLLLVIVCLIKGQRIR